MAQWQPRSDAVHWYMQELSSRVVAESGIPTDRHHLGKLTLQGFKDAPEFVCQIDGATDETETFGSALNRSVQCATAFRKFGLKHGDVIVLMAPNHIHLTIPMYAAFYLGIAVAGIDMTLEIYELRESLRCNAPKMIFCQSERLKDVRWALQELNFDTHVVTFDKCDECLSFPELLEKYGSDVSIDDFKAADFDPAETILLLIATSGTTGLPKSAAVTHKNMVVTVPYMWLTYNKFPTPTRLPVVFSPIQWYSALFQFTLSPTIRHSRLQSSAPMTQEHVYYLINKYKPTFTMTSPNMLETLLKIGDRNKCDFTCFETIEIGGSLVRPRLIEDMKEVSPNTHVMAVYGMSELSGIAFNFDDTQPGSLGKPMQNFEHKLVNPETLKDITEPNVPGELWLKGPGVFKGYYNNPKATAEMLTECGWLRTGDIVYRDDKSNYHFFERMKLLLKYRNHQISPLEIENVIAKHPGVFQVAVTGIPHKEHGDLPVACIVPHEGYKITAQEIKDLVKEELQSTFSGSQPKIIFCQSEKAPDVRLVLNIIDHNATIVTFNDGDFCSLTEFVEKYGDNTPVEDFKPTDFDAENSTFLLLPTSGSTGSPKNVELTFKNFLIAISTHWSIFTTFPTPTALSLVGAPLQWISAVMHYIISPIFKYTRLQSSRSLTTEHACYLINTYKPTYTIFSPTFMATLMKDGIREKCDLSCFENIYLGGSAVPPSLIEDIKNNYPNIEVFNLFGMSEIAGPLFLGDSEYPKSCGKPMNCVQYRIVDIDTQKDISDPNVSGEIWVKGPSIFKGYYKNLAATAEVFTEDGWFKTGDLFYRDEIWNYYFVERIKMLLKYKSHQISPVEIENVIRQHPGVLDVAVSGIQDHECGDLPVACVVAKEGYIVTADEIKGLVKDSLSDSKQLRGGVVFINSIPVTASTKVHRKMLKDMLQDLERQ